ncbi:MAG: transcriptional regulator [Myxococcales bacterium]|nr:MAG: transcriptional regulator [Myxococcales bacterium]
MKVPKSGAPVRGSRSGRPVMAVLDALGRRGALRVGWELVEQPLGFRELQRRAQISSPSLLTKRLREAAELGTVRKDAKGRYELTAYGRELVDILLPLEEWAKRWARRGGASGRSR